MSLDLTCHFTPPPSLCLSLSVSVYFCVSPCVPVPSVKDGALTLHFVCLCLCVPSLSLCVSVCTSVSCLSFSLSLYVSLCPAGLEGGHSKVCLSAAWRSCRGGCLHLSTEECQGLCLRRPLIMSVVSLWRPVINLRCCGDRAAGLTAGTQWGRRKWSRERMGWVGKVLQEERED